jgi:hypothetical protein
MPARRTHLARTKRVAPRNPTRSKKAHARNYGEEAATIRLMPCLAEGRGLARCMGPIHVAHVTARGRGGCKGGRFDIVPLCAAHHRLAGEAGTSDRAMFERLHSLDLRAEADRIALLHSEPNGLRAIAERWIVRCACGHEWASRPDGCDCVAPKASTLGDYERNALFGWVRRAMQAEHDRRAVHACDGPRWAVYIGDLLGIRSDDNAGERAAGAWSLCELAGWPS